MKLEMMSSSTKTWYRGISRGNIALRLCHIPKKRRCNYYDKTFWGCITRMKNHLEQPRKDTAMCSQCMDSSRWCKRRTNVMISLRMWRSIKKVEEWTWRCHWIFMSEKDLIMQQGVDILKNEAKHHQWSREEKSCEWRHFLQYLYQGSVF